MHPALSAMQWLPWMLSLTSAAVLVFLPARGRPIALLALAIAWIVGLAIGDLRGVALAAPAALVAAGWLVRGGRSPAIRTAGHAMFVVVGLALALHRFPGFHNVPAMGPVPLSDGAVSFALYLNLDKPLVGFWVLWMWPERTRAARADGRLPAVVGVFAITALACAVLAYGLGMMAWAPKWPERAWVWAANNLLLVAMAEEAFFRGYVQSGLERLVSARRWPPIVATVATAVLFGLAHAAGGGRWVALASVAGVGYGLAYRLGGLRAAMLAHFALNLLHFGLLTYPSLADA